MLFFALYEAEGINNNRYINKKQKAYSLTFRYALVACASTDIITFLGFSLILSSTYDQFLNSFRNNLFFWYLNDTTTWDRFWNKRMWLYYIFTITAFTIGNYLILRQSNIF